MKVNQIEIKCNVSDVHVWLDQLVLLHLSTVYNIIATLKMVSVAFGNLELKIPLDAIGTVTDAPSVNTNIIYLCIYSIYALHFKPHWGARGGLQK